MPKSKGKGGKNRRRGKGDDDERRELIFKEDGQEYAQVLKMLGNGRLTALCFDGVERLCHIRGKMRKKVWVNVGDIVLLGLRDYQDHKADVILKYTADEARQLKQFGELPDTAKINDSSIGAEEEEEDIAFEFGEEEDEMDGGIGARALAAAAAAAVPPWLCPGCALAVPWLCSGCALAVPWLCPGCALPGCALAAPWLPWLPLPCLLL